jgi:hypothetical protein
MTDTQSEKAVRSAFMDLEPDICDLLRAAKLVCQLGFDEIDKIDDLLFFSMRQCQERAEALKEKYYGLWVEAVTPDGI